MRKNRMLLSLLCAGSLITQSGISVMAVESQPVQISDTSDIIPSEIFDVYHKEDQIDFDQILKSYQAYLEGDDEFKKQTDDLFRAFDPESDIFKMTCAYIGLLQKVQLSPEDMQYFHDLIEKVRAIIPELPSLELPAVPPVEEEQKPEEEAPVENPEQKPEENQPAEETKPEETTPEEKDPSKENGEVSAPEQTEPAKPSEPENNETNPSGEAVDSVKPDESAPAGNEEEKPVAVAPGLDLAAPEGNAPMTPADPAGVQAEAVQPEAGVSAPVIEQLVNAELKAPAGASFVNVASFQAIAFGTDRKINIDGLGTFQLLPDFNNDAAWRKSGSSYNTPRLWGQCTWFAWGRFYELYGFNPGFTGNGYQCVDQLLAAHGDKFVKSDMPASGAIFSGDADHNHVGVVLEYDPETNLMTVQEGNLDGISNENWNVAIQDYRTIRVTPEDLRVMYGDVTYAVPKNGTVSVVKSASLKKQPLRTIVLNKLRKSFSNQ